jgi:hypothetical protein
MASHLLLTGAMPSDEKQAVSRPLRKYIRFARGLALVSGVAVGVAAGATVFTTASCVCTGVCGDLGTRVYDAGLHEDAVHEDATAGDRQFATDGSADVRPPKFDGGAGGGPMPAPPLPPAWLA